MINEAVVHLDVRVFRGRKVKIWGKGVIVIKNTEHVRLCNVATLTDSGVIGPLLGRGPWEFSVQGKRFACRARKI